MSRQITYAGHVWEMSYGLNTTYTEAVAKLNPAIEWKSAFGGSYQGEWVAIGRDAEGIFWWHNGSYGSCSGCDWLEGISTEAEAIEFLKEMQKVIRLGTKEEAVTYLFKERANAWDDKKEAIDQTAASWGLHLDLAVAPRRSEA